MDGTGHALPIVARVEVGRPPAQVMKSPSRWAPLVLLAEPDPPYFYRSAVLLYNAADILNLTEGDDAVINRHNRPLLEM